MSKALEVTIPEEIVDALKAAHRDAERRIRAVEGNDQRPGCEEFYRGHNAVVSREREAAMLLRTQLTVALAIAEVER